MKTDIETNKDRIGLSATLGSALFVLKGKALGAVDAWVALYE